MPDDIQNGNGDTGTTPNDAGKGQQSTPPEITEQMVKDHPLYKQVLAESIQRRQQLADYKKQVADLSKPEDKPTDQQPTQQTQTNNVSPELAVIMEKLNKLEENQTRLVGDREEVQRKEIFNKYKIEEAVQATLKTVPLDTLEAIIKGLKPGVTGDDVSPGGGEGRGQADAIREKLRARFGADKQELGPSLFDTGAHRQQGGGVITG